MKNAIFSVPEKLLLQSTRVFRMIEKTRADTYAAVFRGIRMDIRLGDIVRMKKPHPCGSFEWAVERVGMDFKLRCTGCGHQVMLPRRQAEKNIREVRHAEGAAQAETTDANE